MHSTRRLIFSPTTVHFWSIFPVKIITEHINYEKNTFVLHNQKTVRPAFVMEGTPLPMSMIDSDQCFFQVYRNRKWCMTKWPDRKSTISENFQTLPTSFSESVSRENPKERRKLRRAERQQGQERRKKQDEKFFIFVPSDQKPQKRVSDENHLQKKARGARGNFRGSFFCERSDHANKSRHQMAS